MSNKETTLLTLRGVRKAFPGVVALEDVDFTLRSGEIHALLGENGAGKSTLIKVMTGVYRRDGGTACLNGGHINPANAGEAQKLGISTVYQEVNLLPNLSVAHNLYLGREPKWLGLVDWQTLNKKARRLLQGYNIDIDVTQPLAQFSVAIQQLVAIARGVDMSAKVLILDEPTASLDATEVRALFVIMRHLKSQGIGVVFVTHFLDQVYAVCDRITILRNGRLVGEFEAVKLSQHALVGHMLGKELTQEEHKLREESSDDDKEVLLKVEGAGVHQKLQAIDLEVKAGQVVGLVGLLGSGRTELCKMIFGVDTPSFGTLKIRGNLVEFKAPRQAVSAGIGLCPEDRKKDGILGPMSIRENIMIALQNKRGWWRHIPLKKQKELAEHYVKAINIATSDIEKPIEKLSGGNQQKVILARWLASEPSLLILDEPTRGIDVGAHAEIINLIRELCDRGLGLVIASSELEELITFSDKLIVLRDRNKVAELEGQNINQQTIMQAIAGA